MNIALFRKVKIMNQKTLETWKDYPQTYYDEIIKNCPEDRSPILYANVEYLLTTKRGKKETKERFRVKRMVLKGSVNEIKKSLEMRKRITIEHLGGGKKGWTLFQKFDIQRIEIKELFINRFLGYGVK